MTRDRADETGAEPSRLRGNFVVLAAALVAALLAAPAAQAYVYWTNDSGSIGRANLDGSGVDQSFITGADHPCAVAVDGAHVYWANSGGTTIGRANLDGTGANQSFITGANGPCAVAVDGSHVYWANSGGTTIGRANLDGTGVDQSFITTASSPEGVAVDATHVYWSNGFPTWTIGRANLDGTGVAQSLIAANNPDGVAVDGAHVYWADGNVSGSIGRANLDGSSPDQNFITGADDPDEVAVDATHVYWANCVTRGSIGRANLDGTGANQSFITSPSEPCGVAVDALPPPLVHTDAASSVTETAAVLNGSVNPGGSATSYHFEYGPTTAYGKSAPVPDAAAGSDSTAHAVTQGVSGLLPGTTYHCRLVATNAAGTRAGSDQAFTTPGLALTRVSQSHRRWREGSALPHVASARPPVGTTFRFAVNESARVRFVFKQRLPGRRVGGRCVAVTAKNRSKPKCIRLVSRGSLSFSVKAGAHRLRFQGRISKHKRLAPGRYTLIMIAANAAGQRATARLTFTIVKG